MSRPPSEAVNLELRAVLACLEIGVLTVDRSLHVYFANPAGQELIRRGNGLRMVRHRLRASTTDATRQLTEAVSYVAHRSPDGAPPADYLAATSNPVMALAGDPDTTVHRIVIAALISPSARPPGAAGLAPGAEAVLFVDTHRQADTATEAQIFQYAFQLTRAEAILAAYLLSGESLTTAADKLRVTLNTVRSQLRAIFEKTHARRQADLVRLLANQLFLHRLFSRTNGNKSAHVIRSDDAPQWPSEAF